jgi:GNAT superfamily N-acetyltransferase
METVIQALGDRDVRHAGSLLARAFADDPVIGSFLQGRLRRPLAYPAFFRSAVRELHAGGHVWAALEDRQLRGVAAWLPPDPRPLDRGVRLRQIPDRALVRTLFPRGTHAIDIGFAGLAARHPTEPHWYLAFVGVEPDRQSRGLGAQLLAPAIRLADDAGLPCYLETPFRRTFPFYQRLGFRLVEETNTFPGTPPVWTMRREPGSQVAKCQARRTEWR